MTRTAAVLLLLLASAPRPADAAAAPILRAQAAHGRPNHAPVLLGTSWSPSQKLEFLESLGELSVRGLAVRPLPSPSAPAARLEESAFLQNLAAGPLAAPPSGKYWQATVSPRWAAAKVLAEAVARPDLLPLAARAARASRLGAAGEEAAARLDRAGTTLSKLAPEERLSLLSQARYLRRRFAEDGANKIDALIAVENLLNGLFDGERRVRLVETTPAAWYGRPGLRPVPSLSAPEPPAASLPGGGYFIPGGPIQRLHAENLVIALVSGRALLLLAAHPLVVTGQNLTKDPFSRLNRTRIQMADMIFGDRAAADETARGIAAIHRKVGGRLGEAAAGHAGGTRFRADQPELLAWVLGAIYDSIRLGYERWVRPLSPDEKDHLYADYRRLGELMDIPRGYLPLSRKGFDAYMAEMSEGGRLALIEAGERCAELLRGAGVQGPLAPLYAPAFTAVKLLSFSLLPPRTQALFGFKSTAPRRWAARWLDRLLALAFRVLPRRWTKGDDLWTRLPN